MIVRVAESAGFCFGIERAVKTVYEQLDGGKNVYTFGPITHNETVCGELEEKGVHILNDISEVDGIKDSVIIIRSHGVSRDIYDRLKETEQSGSNTIIDATCTFVKKIHKTVAEKSAEGFEVIIVGDMTHPEVQGICGWCEKSAIVVKSADEAKKINADSEKNYVLVAQTTFNSNKFKEIVEILQQTLYNILVVNSICNATEKRQRETVELARISDAMIVIGGKHSSNTKKLFEISEKECKDTYYIQTRDDLNLEEFQSFRCVGITAGASTPKSIIKEVQELCQRK